jgi:hypothetical protein
MQRLQLLRKQLNNQPKQHKEPVVSASFRARAVSQRNLILETVGVQVTKKAPATSRNVQMKDCGNNTIKEVDDQTLQGTIIVEDCPCESRFANNASRIAAVSAEVTQQLDSYMQQVHGSQSKYQCSVQLVSGNGTDTAFHYTCTAPQADHDKIKLGMQQCCTNDQVTFSVG